MDADETSDIDRAERAAADIADPATREAISALIAAVRGSATTADYRSADLQ